jgi:hypothetical protein
MSNGNMPGAEPARMQIVNNGMLAVFLRSDVAYAMTSQGQWAKFSDVSNTITEPSEVKQYLLSRPGPSAQNEYFLAAGLDPDDEFLFRANRVIRSVATSTYADANFAYSGTSSAPTNPQPGYFLLSEYWHQKPFSVKQVLVEFQNLSTYTKVDVIVQQTGVLDASIDAQWNNYSDLISFVGTGGQTPFILRRAYPNNANKGYGVKPKIEIRDTEIKRVILICED